MKDKRRIVRRILARTRDSFNVSAAEVADNDLIGRARLAFVMVGNDHRFLNSRIDKLLEFVDHLHLAEIVGHQMDIQHSTEEAP